MTALEILERASARVASGWIQKDWQTDNCWCAAGAMGYTAESVDGLEPSPEMADALRAFCQYGLGFEDVEEKNEVLDLLDTVTFWNDDPSRTKSQVLVAFTRTIEALS